MKIADLRAKSKEELKDMILGLKKEQFNLRMQASTGELENKGRFKEVRRTIARAHTLITQSVMGMEVVKKEPKATKPKAAKVTVDKKAPAKKTASKAKKD